MNPPPHTPAAGRDDPARTGLALDPLVTSYRKLADVFHELLSEQSLDDLLHRIASTVGELVPYDDITFYEADEAARQLKAVYASGSDAEQVLADPPFPFGVGITGWAVERREPVLANRAERDPRVRFVRDTPPDPESLIVVPLVARSKLKGTLNIYRAGFQEFTEDEFGLVVRFGDAAALAIDNAHIRASLERQAQTDPLTGLWNRRVFYDELEARLLDASSPFALLLLDLDDFKRVNDLHSHATGDDVLARVGQMVAQSVRVGDRVCRIGGDEFAVVAPTTDDAEAHELAGRVTEAVASMLLDEVGSVSVSFGVAIWPEHGTTPAELFASAERAMVAVKSHRTTRVAQIESSEGIVGLDQLALELADCDDPSSALVAGAARVTGARRASLWLPGAAATPVCAALWRLPADEPCWRVGDQLPRGVVRAVERIGFAAFTRAALADLGVPTELQSETTYVGTFRVGAGRGVVVAEFGTSVADDDVLRGLLREVAALAELAFVAVGRAAGSARVPQTTLDALVTRIETADEYSSSRRIRMRALAGSVGRELELDAPELERLQLAAVFHDIGMTGVPESIRMKPGPLTDEERARMERHPAIAEEILAPIERLAGVGPIVRACHERYDGSGYPDGLAGEAIPVEARIVAVCNAYLAMTTASPYRYSLPPAEAIRRLREGAGTHFDPGVLGACCRVLARAAAQDA